jgi:hypothetical protein
VLVPVPDYTAKCTILVTTGKAKYDATKKAIVSRSRKGVHALPAANALRLKAVCTSMLVARQGCTLITRCCLCRWGCLVLSC